MSAATAQFSRRAWVEIDLGALERNLGKIKSALPANVRYVAVVKADAYGHGMAETVSRLLQSGVDCFAVANVREGADVREIGSGAKILVLGALLPAELPAVVDYDLISTISSGEEARQLAALAQKHSRRLPIHVKVDTGMGRLGVWHTEAAALIAQVLAEPALELSGIFTHFAVADSDTDFTDEQRARFLKVLEKIPPATRATMLVHADNSAGIETLSAGSPFNAVRVGLLQYGIPQRHGSLLDRLRPESVLSFHSRIGFVKNLPRGTTVSYNRTHTLARDSRIAIVTAGYGDGIPLAGSNRLQILVRGKRCPVLGRVTMDQTVIDVTDLPEIAVGDTATLIGEQTGERICVGEFCRQTDSIPWEVFCSITKRVDRVYRTMRIV